MAKSNYIWAIGDIHGYASSLSAILKKIDEYETSKIIYLGDYIDRGPEPKKVLDTIINHPCEKVLLMGNHEMMLMNALEGEELKPKEVLEWSQNGYETTLKSFEVKDVISLKKVFSDKYLNVFNSLSVFHVEKFEISKKVLNILFCHAGPFSDYPLEEQLALKNYNDFQLYLKEKNLLSEQSCVWNNDSILQESMSTWDNYLLIHGHMRTQYRRNRNRLQYGKKEKKYSYDLSDIPNPLYFPGGGAVSALDIDTGVDIGGKLTAIGFSEENINFSKGKMILKVIQADSERRTKNVQAVEYDLTLPFTDEISWFSKVLKKAFKKKKKKAPLKDEHAHQKRYTFLPPPKHNE
jgi:serine/threonine protein phosphatase 1